MTRDPLDPQLRYTFDALKTARAPYVVLRGFAPTDELASSVDVDVYIPRTSLPHAAPLLEGAGWLRRRSQAGRHPHLFFDSWDMPGGLVRSLDVVTELCFGDDLQLLRGADAIVARSVDVDGVRVPAAWDALLLLALHILLDKQALSPNNARRLAIAHARAEADAQGRTGFASRFGDEALGLLDALRSTSPQAGDDLRALTSRARRLPILQTQPVTVRVSRVRARLAQLRRRVPRVAILGIDGSGKSTLIANLCAAPSTLRVWSAYLGNNHFRTPVARWLETRLAWHERAEHGGSPLLHRVLANLRTLWWPLELAVRMAIAEHRSELVLYDRFPVGQDDGAPTTLWGRFVFTYVRLTRALLPKPDLVILLDGDDRVIWERKRESPFEVHQRTQQRYRSVVASLRLETAVVRTDLAPPESLQALKSVLANSPAIRRKLYGR